MDHPYFGKPSVYVCKWSNRQYVSKHSRPTFYRANKTKKIGKIIGESWCFLAMSNGSSFVQCIDTRLCLLYSLVFREHMAFHPFVSSFLFLIRLLILLASLFLFLSFHSHIFHLHRCQILHLSCENETIVINAYEHRRKSTANTAKKKEITFGVHVLYSLTDDNAAFCDCGKSTGYLYILRY